MPNLSIAGNLSLGGSAVPSLKLHLTGAISSAAWGVTAPNMRIDAATFTDTDSAASATVAAAVFNSVGIPTFTATNGGAGTQVTATDAATWYIAGAPAPTTNKTLITNAWSIWVDAGSVRLDGSLFMNATNIYTDTTTGMKIGTSATQKLGFWNATPVVQDTGWGATNVTPDKAFDANATTLDELADTLGTLIDTLKTYGILAA